jgi:hypothetical protein
MKPVIELTDEEFGRELETLVRLKAWGPRYYELLLEQSRRWGRKRAEEIGTPAGSGMYRPEEQR